MTTSPSLAASIPSCIVVKSFGMRITLARAVPTNKKTPNSETTVIILFIFSSLFFKIYALFITLLLPPCAYVFSVIFIFASFVCRAA